MNYVCDIAVIGGGAAGLAAAISAKRQNLNLEVYILEAQGRVGKKLAVTGNGRCNITNKEIGLSRYHGEDVSFAKYILSPELDKKMEEVLLSTGITLTYEGEKAYPSSLQAASVVDCLRFECDKIGVKTLCDSKVYKIERKNGFTISFNQDKMTARSVIVAAGLLSGGEKLGSDGSVLKILKDLGYKTVKTTPAIVQLKTDNLYTKQLKGIKVEAQASLIRQDKVVKSFFDEVLFCDYGLSGPAILQISRDALRESGEFFVSLDLYKELSLSELEEIIENRKRLISERNLDEFFTGMLNKRLGQVVLKYCGYALSDKPGVINSGRLAAALKDFRFKVMSHTGFVNSQVTAGGLSTDSFYSDSLMSKKDNLLFACGEILDIDGDCGGFNLRFAFAGGILAGEKAAKLIGK